MSLTRLRNLMRRPALRLVLLLVLAGQGIAATHVHTDSEPHLEASECLACHIVSGTDDVGADSSRCSISPCLTHTLVATEPSWTGFDPREIANARAPPVG